MKLEESFVQILHKLKLREKDKVRKRKYFQFFKQRLRMSIVCGPRNYSDGCFLQFEKLINEAAGSTVQDQI